ncbi:hypothetical protein SAMN05443575_2167 [Jatrophihabitans endophyticus]|uniref:DUF1918 domain-containing protein n=1 Tax=Jatrophihabitans endophyticus TaxID=1206085 RepID=A0A1M5KIG5_9ACTN|nr:hypothetical protein [Jatrophihabitans endophyticus]SHG52541.1 hypothetical protein SAMN05443575_2167 [Jatrophihabitans endophyticus]
MTMDRFGAGSAPPDLEVGDRVVALHHLGRLFRAPVRRGTSGTVVERDAEGTLRVAFVGGRVLLLDPRDVAAPGGPSAAAS